METDFRLWLLGSWTSFFTWKKRTMDRSLQELVKPPGRIYEFEINVSNISGTVRNCESILMWIQQHKQSQIIMFHLHSLIGSSPRVVQIVFVLTFTWGWIWKQIWKPLWAWRLLILVKSIHTLKGQTLVHLAAFPGLTCLFFASRQMNFLSVRRRSLVAAFSFSSRSNEYL